MSHGISDRNLGKILLQTNEICPAHQAGKFRLGKARGAAADLHQGLEIRERHSQLEHEPVQLSFRQGVGAFHFHRVLGGEYKEGLGERVPLTASSYCPLLHDFEQRGLGLRGGTIDLVHEEQVLENRSLLEKHHTAAVFVFIDDVGAEYVRRHKVRRALHTSRLQADHLRERADEEGFSQAGHAFQKHMSTSEDRH
jgi:hypothetical protein